MPPTVIAEGLQFPEGPAFDREGNLFVVEIQGGQVSKIAPDGTLSVFAKTGGGPNGANFGPDGNLYVCNNGGFGADSEQGRLERITPGGTVEVVVSEVDGEPLNSPNDLAFDEQGNLYFTDPVWGGRSIAEMPAGHVCYRGADGETKRLHTGIRFPNGIGVSPDGATLIVCESGTGWLHAFDIESSGVVSGFREFGFLGEGVVPDGFAFDAEGFVLCCGHGSSQISVFGPEGGDKVATVDVEDPRLTNVCFGGPEFKTLYITESGMGRVVATDWERPGMVLFPDR